MVQFTKLKRELAVLAVLIPLVVVLGILLLLWPQPSQAAEGVHVYIQGVTQTYFDDTVSAGDCTVTDTDGTHHDFSGTAICALEAAAAAGGFNYDAQYYASFNAVMITRIGSDADNYPDGSWLFWANGCLAPLGLSDYLLQDGDAIALTFGVWPEDSCMPTSTPTPTPVPSFTPAPTPVPTPTVTPTPDEGQAEPASQQPAAPTPTPTAKATPRPTVAAATTVAPTPPPTPLLAPAPSQAHVYVTVTPQPTPEQTPEPTALALPSPIVSPAPAGPLGGIPLQPADKLFALSLFGVGNAGIGLMIARMLSRF